MIVRWRFGQVVEILEYNLFEEKVSFRCIEPGANSELLDPDGIYEVSFSKCNGVPDLPRIMELIEEQYDFT